MDKEHVLNQSVALFMIIFGAICVGFGSKFDWKEMMTLGAGISGAGIQAITSQIRQTLTAQRGGQVNLNPSDPTVTSKQ